jgi:hypothetical protein
MHVSVGSRGHAGIARTTTAAERMTVSAMSVEKMETENEVQ